MPGSHWRKRLLVGFVAAAFFMQMSCGTLIHPERRGQPAGRLDPAIVVLDAVGLLLFFIPGVIAFAVDFSNGTIYLPPEGSAAAPSLLDGQELRTIRMSPAELTPGRLEAVVKEQTGQAIRLETGAYRVSKLNHIHDFSSSTLERLKTNPTAETVVFRGKPSELP